MARFSPKPRQLSDMRRSDREIQVASGSHCGLNSFSKATAPRPFKPLHFAIQRGSGSELAGCASAIDASALKNPS
jgi:hypothetical protein